MCDMDDYDYRLDSLPAKPPETKEVEKDIKTPPKQHKGEKKKS
jgi:hypothetical protein